MQGGKSDFSLLCQKKSVFLHPISQEIAKRYARPSWKKREKFQELQGQVFGSRVYAWTVCTFSVQGNSHDLFQKKRHTVPRFFTYPFVGAAKENKNNQLMKRALFLLTFCAMAFQMLNAQDIIVTKQSTRIDAKILEVSDAEVRYKKTSNLDGPTFVMSTSEIASILYANGEVQQFSSQQTSAQPQKEEKNTKNAPVTLYRMSSAIVCAESYPYEIPGLKKMIGTEKYEEYQAAQKHFIKAQTAIAFGWIDLVAGALSYLWGVSSGEEIYELGGYVLLAASDVLLPVGYIVKGVNAGRISRIAEGYNASQQARTEMSLSMSPTLLYNHGQVAPGVGLTLRF